MSKKKIIIVAVILLLVAGLGVTLKLYLDTATKLQGITANPTTALPTASAQEVKQLVKKVGTHMILPKDNPKVITISNVDLLKKDQPFFSPAKDGDKLLVYKEKIILYDPIVDKIIDMAAIRLNTPENKTVIPTQTIKKYNILLLNGTENETINPTILQKLNDRKDINLTVRDASSQTYTTTILTNISDTAKDMAAQIAKSIDAKIFPVATGETIPEKNIDFVIIIGSDKQN